MRKTPAAPIKRPDLIVFDLDGTLTDISDNAARVSSVSDKLHLPVSTATFWLMKTAHRIYKTFGLENVVAEAVKKEVMETLCAEKTDMFNVLNTTYNAYIPCSLLSNGPREWGERVLNRMQIRHFFNQVTFREDVPYLKPDPLSLLPILEENSLALGKEGGTVWICGDRASDVSLALNTNAYTTHTIIPVALNGSKAAETIISLRDTYNIEGYVFNHPYHMACEIDPGIEDRLAEAVNNLQAVQEHVVTLSIQ